MQLQGEQVLKTEVVAIPRGSKGEVEKHEVQKLVLEKPGAMKPAEYDRLVADLVNFLVYMGEPAKQSRVRSSAFTCWYSWACCSCSPMRSRKNSGKTSTNER